MNMRRVIVTSLLRGNLNAPRLRQAYVAVVLAAVLGGCAGNPQQAADAGNSPAADRAQIHLELAQGYFQRGEFDVALSEANAALQSEPDDAAALTMRALVYSALHEAADARADYRRALSLEPDNPTLDQDYGWFLCNQRRYGESFRFLRQALAPQDSLPSAKTYLALGVCEYRDARFTDAVQTLTQGLRAQPGNPALQTDLAMALYRDGKPEAALRRIRMVDDGPYASPQSLWVGILLARMNGHAGDASRWTSELIENDPGNHWSILAQQGRFSDTSIFKY